MIATPFWTSMFLTIPIISWFFCFLGVVLKRGGIALALAIFSMISNKNDDKFAWHLIAQIGQTLKHTWLFEMIIDNCLNRDEWDDWDDRDALICYPVHPFILYILVQTFY
jgi:hypothetical protein